MNSAEDVWFTDPALTAEAVGVTDLRQGMIGKRYTVQVSYIFFRSAKMLLLNFGMFCTSHRESQARS
jgi:hypothetical protein